MHIFLGIYRAGLAELQAYTVSVSVGSTPLDGTVLLPGRAYPRIASRSGGFHRADGPVPGGFRNYRFERERDHSRGCMGV